MVLVSTSVHRLMENLYEIRVTALAGEQHIYLTKYELQEIYERVMMGEDDFECEVTKEMRRFQDDEN